MSNFWTPTFDYELISRQMQERLQQIEVDSILPDDYFEKTLDYQKKSLEILHSINENTANLYTMVELISKNNDKQDEIIALLGEILGLAKAKDKESADKGFKKVMNKITEMTSDVETIIKLTGWATTIYEAVTAIISNIGG